MSSITTYNDAELFRQIAAGDETAFQQFYNHHWNKIYSLALAYLKSIQLAEDTVQETFLKLWAKRESLTQVEKPDAFIYIMGRNEVINALKKKVNMLGIEDRADDPLPDDLLDPQQAFDLKQLNQKISTAIDSLPSQQKLILRLSREEGLRHEQIAQRLGIEKVTVKNHIVRALHTLRRELGLQGNGLLFWFLLSEWLLGH